MDWANERYVRLYVRDTADILAIGWEGRALFSEILRKVDRAGLFDSDEPEVIAELIRMPIDLVEKALPKLLKRGMVQRVADGLLVPNFLEAQEAKSSDAQRSRELRARRRDQAKAKDLGVTHCDEQRDDSVTNRDGAETKRDEQPGGTNENVTPSCTTPSRTTLIGASGDEQPPPELELESPPPKPKPRPKSKPKKPPKANPDHQRFVDGFHQLFLAAHGSKPTWRAKEMGIVKNLLASHGADEALRRAKIMFRDPPPFPPPPHDLGTLSVHFDKFAKRHSQAKPKASQMEWPDDRILR